MSIKLLDFDDAHKLILSKAIDNGVSSYNDWQRYAKHENFPKGVPKHPQITYKGRGWVSWGHWLGNGNISNKQKNNLFLDYDQAKLWIQRNIGVKSAKQWFKSSVDGFIPSFIPTNPNRTYNGKGWVSWGEWFGTGNVTGGYSVRKYKVNADFFAEWSPNMAYVLGFWFADGCMKDHRRFSVYQHRRGRYLLENILEAMGSDYPVHEDKRNCCYFEISSEKMCQDIRSLGGETRKSLSIKMPKSMPSYYLRDFLRGFFDGDGCITYDRVSKCHFSYFSCASPIFLKELKERLAPFNIYGTINSQISIKFNKENTERLGKFLYYDGVNDNLLLKIKRDKFIQKGLMVGDVSSTHGV